MAEERIKCKCPNCGVTGMMKRERTSSPIKCPKCNVIGVFSSEEKPVDPATQKQKDFADNLGIAYPDDISKSEISVLIDAALENEQQQMADKESQAYADIKEEILSEIGAEEMLAIFQERNENAIIITFDDEDDIEDMDINMGYTDNINPGMAQAVITAIAVQMAE
jgi:endogenous inhibitor of DNA gyrase (YacG/DUF329 family)